MTLQPNEETSVIFKLGKEVFAFVDVNSGAWRVESGTFEILVGASSQDIGSLKGGSSLNAL